MNGFSYAILGIPPKDLEKPWYDVNELAQQSNHSSTLLDQQIVATICHVGLSFLLIITCELIFKFAEQLRWEPNNQHTATKAVQRRKNLAHRPKEERRHREEIKSDSIRDAVGRAR